MLFNALAGRELWLVSQVWLPSTLWKPSTSDTNAAVMLGFCLKIIDFFLSSWRPLFMKEKGEIAPVLMPSRGGP